MDTLCHMTAGFGTLATIACLKSVADVWKLWFACNKCLRLFAREQG
jgi:hypothetical protein